MTFSTQILVGLVLGILTGLFFGEDASVLKGAADGFVKLLQMMVLPYIVVSIISSLGGLQPSELRTLGLRAAAVIGGANLAGGSGTAFGALVGAALIEIIRNSLGLLGINAFWQGTFIGGAILLAVLFDRVRNFRQSE